MAAMTVGCGLLCGCESNWSGGSRDRWPHAQKSKGILLAPGPRTVETGKHYVGEFYARDRDIRERDRGIRGRDSAHRENLKEPGDPGYALEQTIREQERVRPQSKRATWPRVDHNDNLSKMAPVENTDENDLKKAMVEYQEKLRSHGAGDQK